MSWYEMLRLASAGISKHRGKQTRVRKQHAESIRDPFIRGRKEGCNNSDIKGQDLD